MNRFEQTPSLNNWFAMWAEEAKKAGYIHEWWDENDIEPYKLQGEIYWVTHSVRTIYKGTRREQEKHETHKETVFEASTYTPDFKILWTEKARGVLFETATNLVADNKRKDSVFFLSVRKEDGYSMSVVDVKSPPGSGGKNCSDASFRVNSKWLFQKFNEVVNKTYLMPNKKVSKHNAHRYLFLFSWTPNRFLYTDKTLVKKSIKNWLPRSVSEFLHLR